MTRKDKEHHITNFGLMIITFGFLFTGNLDLAFVVIAMQLLHVKITSIEL